MSSTFKPQIDSLIGKVSKAASFEEIEAIDASLEYLLVDAEENAVAILYVLKAELEHAKRNTGFSQSNFEEENILQDLKRNYINGLKELSADPKKSTKASHSSKNDTKVKGNRNITIQNVEKGAKVHISLGVPKEKTDK